MATMTIITAGSILLGGTLFALCTGWLCSMLEQQEHMAEAALRTGDAAPRQIGAHTPASRRGAA